MIDRRRSAAGQRGGRVGARHDDDPPPDRRGIEIAGEGAEDNLPLILIPVHAAGEECGRALAVADHSDWNDDLAIGGTVVGPRNTHRAPASPGAVKIDIEPSRAGARGDHAALSLMNEAACAKRPGVPPE